MAATADTQKKNVGRIEEIQGVVIEVVFPDELPGIYNAITVDRGNGETLVLEVQQERLAEVTAAVRGCMTAAASLKVPLKVDVGTGANWDEAH